MSNKPLPGNSDLPEDQNRSTLLDAQRYRWLRAQHWSDSPLAVVLDPRDAVKLGHQCPSLELLDVAIDAAMAQSGTSA